MSLAVESGMALNCCAFSVSRRYSAARRPLFPAS